MKYLKISNHGVLDVRLVALMGGTTKSKDIYKIGKFGTGLKYYISFCLRNNIDFRIFCGNHEVKIESKAETIAGEEFEIIYIDGERTSLTTNMGTDWLPWMIIREIWCNALDEGGESRSVTSDLSGEDGKTVFYTQMTSEIAEVVDNWEKYFIHNQTPIFSSDDVSVYPGGDRLRIYKNGVLIFESSTGKKSVFGYDLKSASINELREFRGSVGQAVTTCLYGLDVVAATYFLNRITDDYEESDLDLNWFGSFGDAWKEAIGNVKLIHKKAIEAMRSRGIEIDEDKYLTVPKNVFDTLTKKFKGVSALMIREKIGEFYPQYDKAIESRVNQALSIIETCGKQFDKDIIFAYGYFGDKNVNARVDIQAKTVFISNTLAESSLFKLVSILIEELEHYNTGFSDCSRDFQTHFIELYTSALLKVNGINL